VAPSAGLGRQCDYRLEQSDVEMSRDLCGNGFDSRSVRQRLSRRPSHAGADFVGLGLGTKRWEDRIGASSRQSRSAYSWGNPGALMREIELGEQHGLKKCFTVPVAFCFCLFTARVGNEFYVNKQSTVDG
jgi:hypothetical protein